jgi:hypothetical protein
MPRPKQKTALLGEQTVRILLGVPLMQAGWLIHALCDWIENDREPAREETPDDCIGSWIAIHDESVRIHESRKVLRDNGLLGGRPPKETKGKPNGNQTETKREANGNQDREEEKEKERDILRNESESEVAGKPASASASASVFTDLDSLDWFTLPERALVDRALALIGEEGNARMAGRLRKARRILGLPAFRELLATFDSELRAGEVPANKGATLNARLSAKEACR